MWKRLAVLVVVSLLPVSALAHTKLFYRVGYSSDYRKVEVTMVTPEPTEMPTAEPIVTPLVEIPLGSALTPEPMLTSTPTPIPSEVQTITPTEVLIPTPEVPDQITTPTELSTTPKDLL